MTVLEQARVICLLAAAAFGAAMLCASARAENPTPPAAAAPPAAAPAPQQAAEPAPAGPGQAAPGQPAAPARGLFPPQPSAPGADAAKPNFFNQLGKWWDDGVADFNAKMKDAKEKLDDYNKKQSEAAKEAAAKTQEAMKNAAQATKDAASAMVRLSNSHIIELKDKCPMAANGAPDCATTAINACHAKGYSTGQPADVRSTQACPASILLSGRTPGPGECPTENVLMRAVCQ
jgi:hypothetical protein